MGLVDLTNDSPFPNLFQFDEKQKPVKCKPASLLHVSCLMQYVFMGNT